MRSRNRAFHFCKDRSHDAATSLVVDALGGVVRVLQVACGLMKESGQRGADVVQCR
jgi:hypothetical protein